MTTYRQVWMCPVCDKELAPQPKTNHKICYLQIHFAYHFMRKYGYRKV